MKPTTSLVARCVLFLAFAAVSAQAAAPANQDFESVPAGTASARGGALTLSGVVYSSDATNDRVLVNPLDNLTGFPVPSVGTGKGINPTYDGTNTGTYIEFAAVSPTDNFKMVSLNAEVWGGSVGTSEIYTITGYDGASQVASATVNFRVAATYGTGTSTISYNRLTTSDETTSSNDTANCGTLTFTGSAWANIDRVRMTVASTGKILTVIMDNLVFAAPVVPNSAPTDISLSSASITQTAATANATIGTLTSTDADSGDTFTYTLVSGTGSTNNAAFAISGAALKVGGTALPAGSYSVRVSTTDSASNTFEKVFAITVSDNVAPTVASITRLTPSTQGLAAGTTSATYRVVFSESVTGVTAARFAVVAVGGGTITGTIGTVTGSGTTYNVPVTITGGTGEFRLKVID